MAINDKNRRKGLLADGFDGSTGAVRTPAAARAPSSRAAGPPTWMSESGAAQLQRRLQRSVADEQVRMNPHGPPALVRAPAPQQGMPSRPQVMVNPTGTDVARTGALRPERGPWSPGWAQPMTDGAGNLITPGAARAPAPAAPGMPAAAPPANLAGPQEVGPPASLAGPAPAGYAAQGLPTNTADINSGPPAGQARPPLATTSGSATTAPQATSVSGRALGYGRMEDGVRVFSDGTGVGSPTASLSRPQIEALAQRNVADSIVPAAGVAMSEVTGGRGTPDWGGGLGRPLQGAVFAPPSAEMQALHRARDFAAGDTRSAAGRAGAALRDLARPGSNTTRRFRGAVADAFGRTADGMLRGGHERMIGQMQEEGATNRTAMEGLSRLQQTAMQGEAGIAQEALRGQSDLQRTMLARQPVQVPLEDGTLGLLGPDYTVRQATGPDGQAVRPMPARGQVDQKAYAEAVSANINRLLGVDPVTGQLPGGRQPTPQEIEGAQEAAIHLANQVFGPQGQQADQSGPPAAAIQTLRQDPRLRDEFDAKYGKGAAARYLGS